MLDSDEVGGGSIKIPAGPVVKVSPLTKSKYNRGRRRTHGASKTLMPSLRSMADLGKSVDTMRDPFDKNWMKSVSADPMKGINRPIKFESVGDDEVDLPGEESRSLVGIPVDVLSSLKRMGEKFGWAENSDGDLIQEGNSVDESDDEQVDIGDPEDQE